MNDDLPAGWQRLPLTEVATIIMGQSPPGHTYNTDEEGLPFFQGKADFGPDHPVPRKWCTAPKKIAETADVLISVRAPVGPTNIADQRCAIGRGLAIIRPNEGIPPELIRNQIALQEAEIASWGTGSTFTAISKKDFQRIHVVLPPREVRSSLVELSEITLNLTRSAFAKLGRAEGSLQGLRKSVLAAACSGRLTADVRAESDFEEVEIHSSSVSRPKKVRAIESFDLPPLPSAWRWVQLHDVVKPGGLFDGPFGSNLKGLDYIDRGARVVRLENIGHLEFIDKKAFVSEEKYQSLIRHAVHPRDIIFSSFLEERVRVCMLPDDFDDHALAKADCFTIRPDEDSVVREYLLLQLASPWTYGFMQSEIHGMTRPRVNTTQLRSLPIPICSKKEQIEVVRKAKDAFRVIDQVRKETFSAKSRLAQLSRSISAKAFRGELGAA